MGRALSQEPPATLSKSEWVSGLRSGWMPAPSRAIPGSSARVKTWSCADGIGFGKTQLVVPLHY